MPKKTRAAPQPAPSEKQSPPPATDAEQRAAPLRSQENRGADSDPTVQALFASLRERLPALTELLGRVDRHWGGEDGVYRFYHRSWKVYRLQDLTTEMVAVLQAAAPEQALDPWFLQIVREGTGKAWAQEHNARWLEETRPILEAFFHARYFLAMAVKYAGELERAPQMMPSGWAAILCLYGMR